VVVRCVLALLLSRYAVTLHPGMRAEAARAGAAPQPADADGGDDGKDGPMRLSAEEVSALTHVAVVTKLRGLRVRLSRLPE
jgi:hypothetical protein